MRRETGGAGLALAVMSAATFGTSGSFATALIDAGWSPSAAVAARVGIAALVLLVPAVLQMRAHWPELRGGGRAVQLRRLRMVTVYGLVAVAAAQLCYFHAVQRLSVGVALLLEYLGIVLIVGWIWLRHGQRPRRLTVVGTLASLVGLALVLDLTGSRHLDLIGVLWGLGAAVGLAVFFVMAAGEDESLPPLVMACGGLLVGAVALVLLGAVGAVPMHATFGHVVLAGHRTSWLGPVLGLAVVAAAFAYVAGIAAARLLGAKVASFVGLTEVLFAVLWAWLLLDQLPTGVQLAGGVFIICGVALVRLDEPRRPGPPGAAVPVEPELAAASA